MDTAKAAQIKAHARELAKLLYDETAPEQLKNLEGIEIAIRDHFLEHIGPEIGSFFAKQRVKPTLDEAAPSAASSET